MKKRVTFIKLFSSILVLAILSSIASAPALAQTDQSNPVTTSDTAGLQLNCAYPAVSEPSGQSFVYLVELVYSGTVPAVFTLKATAPPKWTTTVLRETDDIEVPQIELTGNKQIPDAVRIAVTPPASEYPLPGEYPVIFQANSGDIQTSLDLTAKVTAVYGVDFSPTNGNLYANAKAGQDNHISLTLSNIGTTPVQDIRIVNTEKPSGWNISFTPDNIVSLEIGTSKEIDMLIAPPGKSNAGDYKITIQAIPAEQPSATSIATSSSPANGIDIRVTVVSSTILGWVAVFVILGIIAGVAVLFRRAHIW